MANLFINPFPLSSLNGTNGFRLKTMLLDRTSTIVSGAGDINGDGIDDLIIGIPLTKGGISYVVFGSKFPFPSSMNLSSLNGSNGFQLKESIPSRYSCIKVSGAGDINGDGLDDLIIGAPDNASGYYNGASYVVFGSKFPFPPSMNLSSLNGSNGFELQGEQLKGTSGFAVSGAGDINGDGIDDLIIGAPLANSHAGISYVVFGSKFPFPPSMSLSSLNGKNGFRLKGVEASDNAGRVVSGAGDINGDGMDDLIIGAPYATYGAGISYVLYGSKSPFPASMYLSSINGKNGFQLNGEASHDYSGRAVSGAGDINGDGFADLLIATAHPGSAASYVVFGSYDL
ncbi:FG-GAP repeat protein [Holosporaceae bacterium 'Namur']|nr:FG-GAP repeat protein [Holosporaceae bacterium 'Namur']